jgi:hypothetical protein
MYGYITKLMADLQAVEREMRQFGAQFDSWQKGQRARAAGGEE